MFRALFICFLMLLAVPAAAAPDYTKDPVVMVHGYFLGEVGTWTWMKDKLVEEGWPAEFLYSFQFNNVFGCNPEHGNELKAVVDKALAETGRDRVDILCHSMGCVDARYYIKFLCGYERVKDMVSIAGAHKGSTMGCLEPISCGAEAMCVGPQEGAWMQNDFLFKLNWCDITPGKAVKYTSIWSPLDEIIIPQENSIIEGAWNIKLQALAEHALILANQETAGHVIAGLNGGGTNNNMPTAAPPCVTICDLPDEALPDPLPDVVEDLPDVVEGPADVVDAGGWEIVAPVDGGPGEDGFPDDLGSGHDWQGAADKTGTVPTPIETDALKRAEDSLTDTPQLHPINRSGGGCNGTGDGSTTALFLLLFGLGLLHLFGKGRGTTAHAPCQR